MQKTASELRISDCSSDVCSSDLEGNAASLAANLEAIRKKVDADPRLARGSAGVQYRNSLDYLIGQTSEVTTLAREGVSAQAYDRLQIGRASCRERVCQYV